MIAAITDNSAELPLFSIDKYIYSPDLTKNTGDWSYYHGHYYSNKAPFLALAGAPIYFLLIKLEGFLGIDHKNLLSEVFNFYILNIFLSVIPLCFAAVLFYRLISTWSSAPLALAVSIFLFSGTLLFPFSTGLWGHSTAAALLIFTLQQINNKNFTWAGLWAGLGIGTEYTSGFACIVITLFILLQNGWRPGLKFTLAALPPISLLLAYNWICFGDPLTSSIALTNQQFQTDNTNLGVLSSIKLSNIWALIFSFQGLIPIMPGLALLPLILLNFKTLKNNKSIALLNLFLFLTILLIISAFNGWHGGASVGPRYLIPVIPCLCLLLSFLPNLKASITALYLLSTFSFVNMLVIASVSCIYVDQHTNPLYGGIYKFFIAGQLSPYKGEILLQAFNPDWNNLKNFASFNLGQLVGLPSLLSLLPLFLILIVPGIYLVKSK